MNPDNLISEIQEEIKAADPESYYAKTYWKHEAACWRGIPSWIVSDYGGEEGLSCLDIGAAYGTLSIFCKRALDCIVHALDCRDYYFNEALRRKNRIPLTVGNIQTEDFSFPELFDFVIMTEVLEHFNFNPALTMLNISYLLKPGGRIYISTPDGEASPKGKYKYYVDMPDPDPKAAHIEGHIHHYDHHELNILLVTTGFQIERFELPDPKIDATKIRLSARRV